MDLDIVKSEIDSNEVNEENLKLVKKAADEVCAFLTTKNIPFLLEFSGRRGFHIWVFFERLITKNEGYQLVNYIHRNVKDQFDKVIVTDKFPKTPIVNANTKGVGLGIKLPLSQNKSNEKLSFLLRQGDPFEYDQQRWISKPNRIFLEKQLDILNETKAVTTKELSSLLEGLNGAGDGETIPTRYFKGRKVNTFIDQTINLDQMIESLCKCDYLKEIFEDYELGLSESERQILVGLFIKLETPQEKDFGYNLLMELFSNVKGFNRELTEKKLADLKYYQPITCNGLGRCSACKGSAVISPVQLANIDIVDLPMHSIRPLDEKLLERIKNAVYHYSLRNDEVPLYSQLKRIGKVHYKTIFQKIDAIFGGERPQFPKTYVFRRNEGDKIRWLHNLDAENNVISTYFLFLLNTIYYTEITDNSYGYRFAQSFYQNNIFEGWFPNWAKFIKKVENYLFGVEYEEYYLLKIDIKSFYDSINIPRLKVKLYEEAPKRIKQKLSEFSPEDLTRYKNVIDYLINLSVATTGNSENGLPQGPAYARYLAELYLNGLDDLIENHFIKDQKREFYHRFVDDIFIFVENKERGHVLSEKINEWLAVNGLKFNTSKTRLVNVKEYAASGNFQKFKNNAKYDINSVNKNKKVLSEEEIQEAFLKLGDLADDTKFGLKDNLRFFYSQFKGDDRLNFIRKKLSRKLPYTVDGRGGLYMLFYADLLSNFPKQFWEVAENIDQVKGLSLTHYLNTMLLNEDLLDEHFLLVHALVSNTYQRSDLTDADKLLIASLVVKCNLTVTLNYFQGIMYEALETPNMKYTQHHWEMIREKLENTTSRIVFIGELNRIIENNTFEIAFLNELAKYSFIRFSEWKTDGVDEIDSHELLSQFYHCLCFLTLFENSQDHSPILASWKLLLEMSVALGEFDNKDHNFYWIGKLQDFQFSDFSNESYSLLLSHKKGTELSSYACKNEFLEQYRNVLIILLFAKAKSSERQNFRSILKDAEGIDSRFFAWLNDNSVSLYPSIEDICLKNIALNGLIVLSKSDKLFVKSINKKIDAKKYDYLNAKTTADEQEIIYAIGTEKLPQKLLDKTVLGVLKNLAQVVSDHEEFCNKYQTGFPFFYNTFDVFGCYPAVPFYSDFEKITTFEGVKKEINFESYWENISNIVQNHLPDSDEIKLTAEESDYNFNITQLDLRFYPISQLLNKSALDKWNFLKEFVSKIKEGVPVTLFQFQYYWSLTVLKKAKELTNEVPALVNFLKIHFENFDDPNSDLDVLFAVNEQLLPQAETLAQFFDTIKSSIDIFESEIQVTDLSFIDEISLYLPTMVVDNSDKTTFDRADFKRSKVRIEEKRNRSTGESNYSVTIDEKTLPLVDGIYSFNHLSKNLQVEKPQDLMAKTRGSFVYSFIQANKVYLYFPENELVKAYNRIEVRKKAYDEIFDGSNTDQKLKSLFPVNQYFIDAQSNYENFPHKLDLERKLKIQYKHGFKITDRVINWLSIFNKDSIVGSGVEAHMIKAGLSIGNLHSSILYVLNAHASLSEQQYEDFKELLLQYVKDYDCVLFPIKNPKNDSNGLYRLLRKYGYDDNRADFNFEKNFGILCKEDISSKKLIILVDIGIRGGQIRKAFGYYNTNFTGVELSDFNSMRDGDKKSPEEEKYFTFTKQAQVGFFQDNLRKAKEIVILSPIMTKEFVENTQALFNEINPNLTFKCIEPELDEKQYLFGNVTFHRPELELFKVLVSDVALLRRLFPMNKKTAKHYRDSLEELDKANLLFRVGSLPAMHIKLFTAQPTKGHSLLDYIGNWK
ncbi:MAG: reverse transcriptase domain-containing protein [Flavobacterium sp.]